MQESEQHVKLGIRDLLKTMVEMGASDLHITTGAPPQVRVDGQVTGLKHPPLQPAETKQLCYSILTDMQKRKFEEENELDLSFGVKGLARFRGNIYLQRGASGRGVQNDPVQVSQFRRVGFAAGG